MKLPGGKKWKALKNSFGDLIIGNSRSKKISSFGL